MTPLPFVWRYALLFWVVFFWAFWPEFGIILRARRAARAPGGNTDRGSLYVIVMGMNLAMLIAFPLAWVRPLRFPAALGVPMLILGTAMIFGGSLLRRHCWRMLGT